MPITVSPLSEAIGARIEGVDLSRELDAGTFDTIKGALFEHAIIVVPGQTLDEDDQERFCRYFGELEMVRSGQALGRDHPAPFYPNIPLDRRRRRIGVLCFAVFASCFSPVPFSV